MKVRKTKDITDRINAFTKKIEKLAAHLVNHKKDKGVVRAIRMAAANKKQLEKRLIINAKDTMESK